MHLAISGTEFEPDESVDLLLQSAITLQIPSIELWHPRNTAKDGLGATLKRISDSGVKVACVSTGTELYRDGGSLEDQRLLIEAIQLTQQIGASITNTYFGHDPVRDDARAIATYRRYLEPCLEEACRRNVTIVLENEFDAFGWDPASSDITRRPASLRQLVAQVNDPHFRLNFDPCNFYCAGIEPYPYAYRVLAPFISYCHVKDGTRCDTVIDAIDHRPGWRRFRDYEHEFVTTPMGKGAIPWSNLLASLRADGYQGFLTLEPHAQVTERSAAWRQAADSMRSML